MIWALWAPVDKIEEHQTVRLSAVYMLVNNHASVLAIPQSHSDPMWVRQTQVIGFDTTGMALAQKMLNQHFHPIKLFLFRVEGKTHFKSTNE